MAECQSRIVLTRASPAAGTCVEACCCVRLRVLCLQASKTINGTPMYTYEIASDKRNYLATIGKKGEQAAGMCACTYACMHAPLNAHTSGSAVA